MEDIGILLRLEGAEQALASAKQLEATLNGMDKKTYTAKIRMANAKLGSEIAGINKALVNQGAGIRRINQDVVNSYKDRNLQVGRAIMGLKAEKRYMTDNMKATRKHAAFKSKQLRAEKQWLSSQKNLLDQSAYDYAKTQKTLQTGFVQAGSQLQTLGNTLGRITAPFTRLFSGALLGAGFAAVNKVTEGLTNAFNRYDIIETYEQRLNQLGLNASKKFAVGMGKAQTAFDNLDESVRGLPTGVDEMIDSMSRYAGATGDVERATKLAIAANNAFIAGQMDDRQKLFTERQLLSLAGGAELAGTQWDSLRRNAPLAMRVVAKAMKKTTQEMISDLKQGRISGEEFLDTFIKVGTEGKLQSAAQKMKMTWSAVSQNITNAFSRMGYNVLNTLDSVFEKATGRNLLQDILGVDKNGNPILDKNGNPTGGIKNYIDNLSKDIQGWIKANPNAILDFWERLKNFDIAGVMKGFIKTVSPAAKAIGGILSAIGGEDTGKWLGRAVVVSKGLSIVGGALKGFSLPLSVLGAGGMGLFNGAKLAGFGKFMGGLSKIGSGIKAAAFSRLADVFSAAGKLGKADAYRNLANITRAGKPLKGATKAVQAMDTLQTSIINLANKALNIAGIMAFAKSIEWIAKAFKTISTTNLTFEQFTGFAAGAGALIAEFAGIAQLLGTKGVVTGIAQASRLLGTLEIAAISKTIQLMAKAMNEIATAKMPAPGRVSEVMGSMADFLDSLPSTDLFTSLGKTFSASAVGKTAESVSRVAKAMSDIDKLKVNIQKVRDKLFGEDGKGGEDSLVGVMNDLANVSKGDWISSMVKKWDFGNLESVFNSTANMVTSLKTITTTKIKPGDIEKISAEGGVLSQLKDSLKPIVESMDELFNMPIEGESTLAARGGKYKDWGVGKKPITTFGARASQFAKMMENIKTAFTQVQGTLVAIGRMKKSLDARKEQFGTTEDGAMDFSMISSAIEGIAGALTPLTEGNALQTLNNASQGLQGFDFGTITAAFENGIIPLANAYAKIQKIMTEAGITFDPANPLGSSSTGISLMIGQIMGSLRTINETFAELGDMSAFTQNMAALDTVMTSLQSVFNKLALINGLFAEGGTGGGEISGLGTIGTTISTVLTQVNGALAQAPTLMANALMLQLAFLSLNSVFSTLSTMATTAQASATTLASAINAISAIGSRVINISITLTGTVDDGGIPEKVKTIAADITNALASIQPIYTKMVAISIKGKVSDGNIAGRINNVASAIRSAFARIPTSLTKHVSVNIYGEVNKIGEFAHTGGYITGHGKPIYRARGGIAMMTPRGTDTVPAMLSPGEYVMRRKAVDTFGTRFFQGLNHLDLKGALNSLSIRAGQNIKPRGNTVINNKTINNTNKPIVNIHEHNANGNIGLQRAGRWAHGLA